MTKFSKSAMVGAMAGSGFAYSIINGYGILHGLTMAFIYLLIGFLVVTILNVIRSPATT